MIDRLAALCAVGLARLVTGVRANWIGCAPASSAPRIYFANHASHGDFVLIWTVLAPGSRRKVRPVAGTDYWTTGALRRFVAEKVFRSVLIDRTMVSRECNPIPVMADAIDRGASLIVFPEGTRNTTDAAVLPFKSGLYHLAKARPAIQLVPVWIANLNRVLPKGEILPVPLLCNVSFGSPIRLEADETKAVFLDRARAALVRMAAATAPEVS